MYSLPSRSHKWHPFAFFIAIGYGSKYFTPAVTPPGRERRARSAYARDAFVLAARSVPGSAFVMSRRHLAPGRYSLRGVGEHRGGRALNTHSSMLESSREEEPRWLEASLRNHIKPGRPRGIPACRAQSSFGSSTPVCCLGKRSSRSGAERGQTPSHSLAADIE